MNDATKRTKAEQMLAELRLQGFGGAILAAGNFMTRSPTRKTLRRSQRLPFVSGMTGRYASLFAMAAMIQKTTRSFTDNWKENLRLVTRKPLPKGYVQ